MNDPLLDHLLLNELADAWRTANWTWFREAMIAPAFALAEAASFRGHWTAATRTLTLERGFAHTAPWAEVLDVLHHEMAHQYVSEVLRVTDETAHGPAFRKVLDRIGVVAPSVAAAEDASLAKVRKLLALASSPNQHEAQAAMKAAHRWMTSRNVDLAAARADAGLTVRHIGPVKARHAAWEKLLIGLLSKHFFVQVVWVTVVDRSTVQRTRGGGLHLKHLQVAECTGTPANLDIAAWVHDFLCQTGERLWRAHRKSHGLSGDKERQRYLAGLLVGFRQKLDDSARECREAGLVWVGDPRVDDLVARRHPRLVSRAGIRLVGSEAYHHGKADGREIVLHKPITSTGTGRGGLLEG